MSEATESTTVKRRSKGEKTRALILKSAIEVLAHNGVKGTTHRAVAAHANIQLSLTTYYFKDIQELVYEAFLLSSKKAVENITPTWDRLFEEIESHDKTSLRKMTVKQDLCNKLTDLAAEYLYNKIIADPIELSAEQLMFAEANFNPKLLPVIEHHRQELLKPCLKFCRYFNKKSAEVDADIMLTVFSQLEYRNLSLTPEELSLEHIRTITHRMFAMLMRLKP
ncbi:TetR/AcrR family transcriptional regulator [Thalassotalea sp. PLHSN55]|uniref:TetR/AcrR family transcriptional regulator n=1 Tax=Thalassotalea sp. PLHSN55 TaxID=3435888 RepID=UPI003F87D1D1